jgi:hypothetical protein
MATTVAMTAPEQEPAKIGAMGRIFGVLFSPGETFKDIARKPTWLPALVLLTVVNLSLNLVLVKRVDWTSYAQQQIEKSRFAAQKMESLNDDQKAAAYAQQATIQKYIRYAAGVAGMPILALLGAGIYLLVFNLIGGAGASYKSAFGTVCFAHIPLVLHDLLGIPIAMLRDPSAINPQNVVASNIGALLPPSAPTWQAALGTGVDLFAIWCMILVAIGFTALNPRKLTFGKSFALVIAIWVFFAAIGTAVAAAFA